MIVLLAADAETVVGPMDARIDAYGAMIEVRAIRPYPKASLTSCYPTAETGRGSLPPRARTPGR